MYSIIEEEAQMQKTVREHAALLKLQNRKRTDDVNKHSWNACMQDGAQHAACAASQQTPEQRVARLQQIRTQK